MEVNNFNQRGDYPGNGDARSIIIESLDVHEAFLNISSRVKNKNLWIYSSSTNCHKCPYQRLSDSPISEANNGEYKIFTTFPTKFRFLLNGQFQSISDEQSDSPTLCDTGPISFGQSGGYNLVVAEDGTESCFQVKNIWAPVSTYNAILFAIIFCVVGILIKSIIAHGVPSRHAVSARMISGEAGQRFQFIDTFRGVCIVLMIFVNGGGGGYHLFSHATWDGLYFADLAFPWFLWLMGVCIPLSIKSQLEKNKSAFEIFGKIFIRSLKMIGLGLVLSPLSPGFVDWAHFRITGVLQRTGICYLLCSTLYLLPLYSSRSSCPVNSNHLVGGRQKTILLGWIFMLVNLMVHYGLTFYLPVPGCPTGYLGPGGLHNNSAWPSHCVGGASGHIDRQILSVSHMSSRSSVNFVYDEEQSGPPFDPEGILGTLTSAFQTWLGVHTGLSILRGGKVRRPTLMAKGWLLQGTFLGVGGLLICGGTDNDGWIPINKNLWSMSFVLVTTSGALVLFTLLYFVVEVKGWWSGTLLFEVGLNPMIIYVAHPMRHNISFFNEPILRSITLIGHSMRLCCSLLEVFLWILFAHWLHLKGIYWVI